MGKLPIEEQKAMGMKDLLDLKLRNEHSQITTIYFRFLLLNLLFKFTLRITKFHEQ